MRRKDREMKRDFALDLIDRADYGSLALVDGGQPYVVPISAARYKDLIYFHSANAGKKVELLKGEPYVSISFVGEVQLPNLYGEEDLKKIQEEGNLSQVVSRVFTTEFESAIVFGQVLAIEDREEKIKGLRYICQKYTPNRLDYFSGAVDTDLRHVNVYCIRIEELSAKRKKYDQAGQEMKWGRME